MKVPLARAGDRSARRHVLGYAVALTIRSGRAYCGGLIALAFVNGCLPVAVAWSSKLLFDDLVRGAHAHPHRDVLLVLMASAFTMIAGAGSQLAVLIRAQMRRTVGLALQDRLYARVSAFPGLRYFEDPGFRDRLQLAEQSAQNVPQSVTSVMTDGLRGAVTITGLLGAVFVVWPLMALLIAAVAAGELVVERIAAARDSDTTTRTIGMVRRQASYRALLTDAGTARELRLFGLAVLFRRRMLDSATTATASDAAIQRRDALNQALVTVLGVGLTSGATLVGVSAVTGGDLTLGSLTLFLAAVAGIHGTLSNLIFQFKECVRTLRLFANYVAVMELPDDLPVGRLPVGRLANGVEFRDVWFRYTPQTPWVLRGVTFTIRRGESVGLVGLNGAGKSTLVKLLCRFYDPQRGQILWDGVDLRELDPNGLRARFGAVFQDFTKYELTARENIGVGDVDHMADSGRVAHAATLAGVHDTLAALPKAYDTLLSRIFFDGNLEEGRALSGGQWQRLALARSLMRDSDLLILDEPNSGMDAAAEHDVHRMLVDHRRGRTSLLISHRLSALRDADQIVVLVGGAIAEAGTHDDLIVRRGEYGRLFGLQAAGYRDSDNDSTRDSRVSEPSAAGAG